MLLDGSAAADTEEEESLEIDDDLLNDFNELCDVSVTDGSNSGLEANE